MGRRNTRVDEIKHRAIPKVSADKQLNSIRRRSVTSSWSVGVSRRLRFGNDGGDQQNMTVTSRLNLLPRRAAGNFSRQDLHKSFARHKLTQIGSSTKSHKLVYSCEGQVNDVLSSTLQWLDSSGIGINEDDSKYKNDAEFRNYNPVKTKEFSQQERNENFAMFKLGSPNSSSPKDLDYFGGPSNHDASVNFIAEEFDKYYPEKIEEGVINESDGVDLRTPSDDFTYISKVTSRHELGNCGDDYTNYIITSRDLDLEQQKPTLPGSTFSKKMSGLDIPVTVIYSSSRPFLSASSRATNISSLSSTNISMQNALGVRYVEEYNKSAGILTTYLITEKEDERTTSSSMSSIKEEDLDTFFLSEALSPQTSNPHVGSDLLTCDLLSEVSELDASLSHSSILSEELSPLPIAEAGLTSQSKLYLALLSDWEADQRGSSHISPLPSCMNDVSVTPPPRPPSPPTQTPPLQLSRRRLRIDLLVAQEPSSPPLPSIEPPAATVIIQPKGPDRSLPPLPPQPPPRIRPHLPSLPTPFLHPARVPPPPKPPPPPERYSLSDLTPQAPHHVWSRLSMPAFLEKETSLLQPPPTTHQS